MDTLVHHFTNMRIDSSELAILTTNKKKSPTPKQLIYALYFENQQLKQQIEQLKALIQSQQAGLPHWVK